MSRLLSANFARLKRDKVFWIGLIVMFGFGAFSAVGSHMRELETGYTIPLDHIFFTYTIFTGLLSAAFCSLFLGTEYSDGTVRNKLVVGHGRSSIYLSNLIVNSAACLSMDISYLLAVSAFGIPLLGSFEKGIKPVAALLGCAILMSLAFTAVFTLLGMLIQNRAVVSVVSIIGVVLLLFAAVYIKARLEEPEQYDSYTYMSVSGELVTDEPEPNPNYLRGTERDIYEFALDFLPTGQALQISGMSAQHLWQMPLYSVIIMILTTAGGLIVFRRADIK